MSNIQTSTTSHLATRADAPTAPPISTGDFTQPPQETEPSRIQYIQSPSDLESFSNLSTAIFEEKPEASSLAFATFTTMPSQDILITFPLPPPFAHAASKQDRIKKLCHSLTKLKTTTLEELSSVEVNHGLNLKEFYLFGHLPLELRNRIWYFVAHAPRTILLTKDRYAREYSQKHENSALAAPVILQICSESRNEGMRYYETCYELVFEKDLTYYSCQKEYGQKESSLAHARRQTGASPSTSCRKGTLYVNFATDKVILAPLCRFRNEDLYSNYCHSFLDLVRNVMALHDDYELAFISKPSSEDIDPQKFKWSLFPSLRELTIAVETPYLNRFSTTILEKVALEQKIHEPIRQCGMAERYDREKGGCLYTWPVKEQEDHTILRPELDLRLRWYMGTKEWR